jgi:anti-sigma factor RsiW
MECREVLARYSDFLDGGLRGEKREEVTKHLERCDRCRSYQKILSEGLMAFRESPKPSLTDDFYLRLQHRLFHLKEGSRNKSRKRILVRWATPTLTASFVFFISVFFVSSYLHNPLGMDPTSTEQPQSFAGPRESVAREADGLASAANRVPSGKSSPESGRRDWDKKFVRNNIWRVFVEPPPRRFVGGGSTTRLDNANLGDVLPVRVSTATEDGFEGLSSVGNPRYVGLGVSVVPVEFQVGDESIRSVKKGLRVLKVKDMTPAHIAGILPGDTIVGIDHLPVEGPEELSQLVIAFSAQSKSIQIYRLGRMIELYVDL